MHRQCVDDDRAHPRVLGRTRRASGDDRRRRPGRRRCGRAARSGRARGCRAGPSGRPRRARRRASNASAAALGVGAAGVQHDRREVEVARRRARAGRSARRCRRPTASQTEVTPFSRSASTAVVRVGSGRAWRWRTSQPSGTGPRPCAPRTNGVRPGTPTGGGRGVGGVQRAHRDAVGVGRTSCSTPARRGRRRRSGRACAAPRRRGRPTARAVARGELPGQDQLLGSPAGLEPRQLRYRLSTMRRRSSQPDPAAVSAPTLRCRVARRSRDGDRPLAHGDVAQQGGGWPARPPGAVGGGEALPWQAHTIPPSSTAR